MPRLVGYFLLIMTISCNFLTAADAPVEEGVKLDWGSTLNALWVTDVQDHEDLAYIGDDPKPIIPAVAKILSLNHTQMDSLTDPIPSEVAVGVFIASCDSKISLEHLPLVERLALISLAERNVGEPSRLYYRKASDFFAAHEGYKKQELYFAYMAARHNEVTCEDHFEDDMRDPDRPCYNHLLMLAKGASWLNPTEEDKSEARRLLSIHPALAAPEDWAEETE
jgi:hypothetical protein